MLRPTANDHPSPWIWLPGNTWSRFSGWSSAMATIARARIARAEIARAGVAEARARTAAAMAALLMLAVLHAALAPSACAQRAPASAIEQLITNDAAARLRDRNATIRGEAALLVGAAAAAAADSTADSAGFAAGAAARTAGFDAAHEQLLLDMARQPEAEARHRALVALGMFGSPAAIQHLENTLHTVAGRSSDDGVLAAYALGMADPARVGTGPARTLALFPRGSWKKQHDALTALLLGLARTGVVRENARGELGSLRRLFENDANRAPTVRALLLDLLLPIDTSWSVDELCNTLRRGSEEEQLAILNWLARRPPPTHQDRSRSNETLRDVLVGIAKRDQSSAHRASALRALTRIGHLPALDLAARSLRRQSPAECAQGLTTIFAIGGASARGALAKHVRQEKSALKKAALLDAYAAPPPPELLAHCVTLAIDAALPLKTRSAAARLVARGAPSRAVPLLRDLFRSCGEDDADELASIARALLRTEAEPTELRRLLQSPATLPNHPAHWTALLRAGHAGAQRAVLEQLQTPDARPEHVAMALRSWRKAVVLPEADLRAPEVLRQALR